MMRCPKLHKILSLVNALIIILALAYVAHAQPLSTIDTVQNLKISEMEDLAVTNENRINKLSDNVDTLTAAFNQMTGAVKGFGTALVIVQGLQLISSWKRGKA